MLNKVEHADVIDAKGLIRQHGQGNAAIKAINGVDLTIKAGEMVALMGPSGSGKSTLMQILGLLDRPSQGEYFLAGKNVSRLKKGEAASLRGRRIGFVFQGIHLLARLSAIRNVELPMVYARFSSTERRQRAEASLARVGLSALAGRRPNQLSGGQAQRIAIARAVAPGPELLLADEPTGALDRASGRDVLALFQELNQELGLTIVIVTHDPLVGQHAQRIVELEDGRIIADRPVLDRIVAHGTPEVGV